MLMAPAGGATQQRGSAGFVCSERFIAPVEAPYFLIFSELYKIRKVLKLIDDDMVSKTHGLEPS